MDGAPYLELGAGFGRSAGAYDREIGGNPAMQYMRQVSLSALCAAFRPGQRVLEIGCGTGEEAIALGRLGVEVLATDVSAEMVALARRKVIETGLDRAVQVRQMAASELFSLVNEMGERTFQGAYSSFGALNGEPDLSVVGAALARLLAPGSHVVVSVMNRFCAFETLWFLLHGRPRQAVRRWGGKALAHVSPSLPTIVPTWYYRPRALARAFGPAFRSLRCQALPLLLPPPFAAHLWLRCPALVRRLRSWEAPLAGRWPLSGLGDHFLMVLQRIPGCSDCGFMVE